MTPVVKPKQIRALKFIEEEVIQLKDFAESLLIQEKLDGKKKKLSKEDWRKLFKAYLKA